MRDDRVACQARRLVSRYAPLLSRRSLSEGIAAQVGTLVWLISWSKPTVRLHNYVTT